MHATCGRGAKPSTPVKWCLAWRHVRLTAARKEGLPHMVFDGGWNIGQRRCGPLAGLVVSLDLVVKALAGGVGHGGAALHGMVLSHKVQSPGETLDPQISRWWRF
jgi:hypothetical protein